MSDQPDQTAARAPVGEPAPPTESSPAQSSPAQSSPVESSPAEALPAPPCLLVVEDDPASRDMLARRLRSRGFRVEEVEDGEACLARIGLTPPTSAPAAAPAKARRALPSAAGPGTGTDVPDLVLLDINLPGAGGLEVLGHIRRHYSHDALPVILVTALGDSEDVVRGLEAGANDYVVKPVDLAVLLARIRVSLRIKFGVRLLMEAERQRVMMETLAEACDQLSQPTTAIGCMLEAVIRSPDCVSNEAREDLRQVLHWTSEVSALIHKLRAVVHVRSTPYTQRMEMLERGTLKGRHPRTV